MPGRNDKKVAVLIPCYNEAGTIEKVIRDYRGVLPDADIYVYDNNSTDGTDEIAARAGAIVRHEYTQGKGNVIRTMGTTPIRRKMRRIWCGLSWRKRRIW